MLTETAFMSDRITEAIYGGNLKDYNYVRTSIEIPKYNIDKILDILKDYIEIKFVEIDKRRIGKNSKLYIEINEARNKFLMDFYASSIDLFVDIQNRIKDLVIVTSDREIIYRNWVLDKGEPNGFDTTLTDDDILDVNEKYYPYLNVNLMLKEFFEGNENILILASEKGTAKSKFISLIMKKFLNGEIDLKKDNDNNILYLDSAKDVSVVSMDKFWNFASDADILVMDDLDFVLSSRDANRDDVEKNKFLSNILSFTDGIKNTKTKIIITTNQPIEELDEALLRAGRLFAILKFRKLYQDEALDIWLDEGLDEDEFYKYFNEEIVEPAKLGNAIKNIKRNKKYISKKEWLLDDSVDGIKKTVRKAGFM